MYEATNCTSLARRLKTRTRTPSRILGSSVRTPFRLYSSVHRRESAARPGNGLLGLRWRCSRGQHARSVHDLFHIPRDLPKSRPDKIHLAACAAIRIAHRCDRGDRVHNLLGGASPYPGPTSAVVSPRLPPPRPPTCRLGLNSVHFADWNYEVHVASGRYKPRFCSKLRQRSRTGG